MNLVFFYTNEVEGYFRLWQTIGKFAFGFVESNIWCATECMWVFNVLEASIWSIENEETINPSFHWNTVCKLNKSWNQKATGCLFVLLSRGSSENICLGSYMMLFKLTDLLELTVIKWRLKNWNEKMKIIIINFFWWDASTFFEFEILICPYFNRSSWDTSWRAVKVDVSYNTNLK